MTESNHSLRALVTGASSGIGLATAQQLMAANKHVVGVARDFSKTLCDGLHPVELDLAKLDELPAMLNNTPDLQAPFDQIILNAGYGRFGGLEQFSHQQIRHLIDTNLVSNLFLLKHYLPLMKANGGGDIVLIGSESALAGGKSGAVYCASKFALRGLAQSLRADCATANTRVILVNPGPVDSDFFDDLNFMPQEGEDFVIEPETVATAVVQALAQPRTVVVDEINIQPIKRAFKKR